ncbi:MAG TPA: DUF4082 domain-containing protein [Nevskiaceae bacterium]|nr:DUF4082 domain-containing protein [Nevskiaceae bacterium]
MTAIFEKSNLNKLVAVVAGLAVAITGYYLITSRASDGLTLFSDTTVPAVVTDPDNKAVELGVKFRSDEAGTVTGIRFYKGSKNTGTHVGNLWAADGKRLASATFINETGSGWQQVKFDAPVTIAAGTTYIASYHTTAGFYSADENFFTGREVTSGPLHALADGIDGPNSVYKYGDGGFPTDSYKASNYYVDVLFTPTPPPPAPSDSTAPTVNLTSPTNGSTVAGSVNLTASATDNTGVTKVEFLVDGVVKATVPTEPFTYKLDTTTMTNGSHTIAARAFDAAANQTKSTDLTTTVNNGSGTTPAPTQTLTFTPLDDANIRAGSPNRNFGGASTLTTSSSPDREYLLKFNLTGLSGKTITGAKLRMYTTDSSTKGGDIRRLKSDAWSETTVTWNNAPATQSEVVGSFGAVTAGSYAETTLTGVVSGDGFISLRGDSTATNTAAFNAKEAGTNPPQLVVTVSSSPDTPPTGDTTAPTAPANLTAVATSPTQVNLTWNASTDNIGVTKYTIYRGGTLLGEATGTSYLDSTATASTSYSYAVKAQDAAGNVSAASNTAQLTTPTPADTTAPSAPGSLKATSTAATQVALGWNASTDNVGVSKYLVYRGSTLLGQTTGTTFTDTTVTPSTAYNYTIKAQDAAGNTSTASNTLSVTTPAQADTTAPTTPTGLQATAASPTQVNLNWTASNDNVGVARYLVYRGASLIAQVTTTSYSDTTAIAGTSYSYTVRAQDAANNNSPASSAATVTTPNPADTSAPSAPTNLAASAVSASQVNLSWTASTDNVGVASYEIFRGGTSIGSTTLTSYGDATVSAGTAYTYTVRAKDAAGNTSAVSGSATATTPTNTPPVGLQLWSSPATWGGHVPAAGDTITIASGTKVLLDVDAPKLKGLTINGELHFADRNTTFRSGYIAVYGKLQLGTDSQPLTSNVTIVLDGSSTDNLTANGLAVGANVMVTAGGGKTEIHGRESGKQWTRLAQTANAGSTTITLQDPVTWQPGDEIVLSSSDMDFKKYDETSVASRSADGRTITLAKPLVNKHAAVVTSFTSGAETRSVEERAEAGLLTHNIKITGPDNAASTKFGGHTMVLAGSAMRVSNTEFVRMGQIGVLGRYPLHWHLTGDASTSSVRNISVHQAFNRFLTIHRTNNLHIDGMVGHDTFGHGIMLEDGVERFNSMNDMLIMTIRRPGNGQRLRLSDDVSSAFWITNPTNDITNSSAAGGEGSGFWYDFNFNSDNTGIFDAINDPLGKFDNIVAHSNTDGSAGEFAKESGGAGIIIEGLYGDANNRAQLHNMTAWKNSGFGMWFDGAYDVHNVYAANNGTAWNGQDGTAQGGLLVGDTANTGAEEGGIGGLMRFYHGQADADNIWLANFEQKSASDPAKGALTDVNASTWDGTNRVKRLKFFGNGYRVIFGYKGGYFNPQSVGHSHWFKDLDGSIKGDGVPAIITNDEMFVKSPSATPVYSNVGKSFFQGSNFGSYSTDDHNFARAYPNSSSFNMTRLDTNETASNVVYPAFILGKRYRVNSGIPANASFEVRGSEPGWFELEFPNSNAASSFKVSGGGYSATTFKAASSEANIGKDGDYFYNSSTRKLVVRITIKGSPIPFLDSGDYGKVQGNWSHWEINR